MSYEISPSQLNSIGIIARRLKLDLPELSHAERLDKAAYLLLGTNTYREVKNKAKEVLSEKTLIQNQELEFLGIQPKEPQIPAFKVGEWYFYPEELLVSFYGARTPYEMELTRLGSSIDLLSFILQIQKKKWDRKYYKKHKILPTFQVDEFISLINNICLYYLNRTFQNTFSDARENITINWSDIIKSKPLPSYDSEVK